MNATNGRAAPRARAIQSSTVTNTCQPPDNASTKPGVSSLAALCTGFSDSDSVMVARLVRSFSDACCASRDSRSASRLLSSPSRVTTSLSLVARSISVRIRFTLARCDLIRLSMSTTWSVTSTAFAVRSTSVPVPWRPARTSSYRAVGTRSTTRVRSWPSESRLVLSWPTYPPALSAVVRACVSALAVSLTSTVREAVRMMALGASRGVRRDCLAPFPWSAAAAPGCRASAPAADFAESPPRSLAPLHPASAREAVSRTPTSSRTGRAECGVRMGTTPEDGVL